MILNNKKAFTLIEILVVIAIIWILIFWVSNIDFGNTSDKQRLESFYYKVKSEIETIKNNSLVWKWIWISLIVPKEWKIDFSSGANTIPTYYSWVTWINYNHIKVENLYKIKSIICSNLDWTSTWNLSWNTWSVIISWLNISLSWCTDLNYKSLKITTWYKELEKTLEINTVSWVLKDL